jgi:hypothetical protein
VAVVKRVSSRKRLACGCVVRDEIITFCAKHKGMIRTLAQQSYGREHPLKCEDCDATVPSSHWDQLRATEEGWFFSP